MRISQKTNIYQVGLIMASAIRLMNPLPENDWRQPPNNYRVPQADQLHHDPGPTVGVSELSVGQLNPGPKKYSDGLINLVWRCLRHDGAQRPTARQLLQLINREQQRHGRFQGMDAITSTSGPLSAAMRELCIDMTPDKYALNRIF